MSHYAAGYRTSDLSRGMTLRNASENRKLVGHLQTLDLQLHQNLVNLQAEIMDLKLKRNGLSHARQQRPKTSLGKTFSDPRHAKDRQLRSTTRTSPLAVQGSMKEISKPFLPQISSKQTALVGKREDGAETRPNSSRRPASSRRLRVLSTDSANLLPTNTTSNLYRPKSTPNLCISPAKSESNAAPSIPISDPLGGGRVPPLEEAGRTLKSRSSEYLSDLSPPSLELSDRVSDFLKRPNTSSGERNKVAENELKRAGSDVIPTINIEEQEEAIVADLEEGKEASEDDKGYQIDEELFRNSLLLKASRDDGLSSSMPDLSSLGFMDFSEVIDQRLRKVQEDIPSEEEMRKIRYLRFRDEPAPLPISSVFEKETVQELDKIDE